MRIAALDLGSHTFLLLIVDVTAKGIDKVLVDELRVTRMGQGVHGARMFHPDALVRARECLQEYAAIISAHSVDRVMALATSAARDVANGHELLKIGQDLNIPIEIISGNREAQLTYKGVVFELPPRAGTTVVDIGGGSTEIVSFDESAGWVSQSLNIGSVRLTEMLLPNHPVPPADLLKLRSYIDEQLQAVGSVLPKTSRLVAVAGTPTTLVAVLKAIAYTEEAINGHYLALSDLSRLVQRMAKMSIAERQQLIGMDPRRADVIVAGGTILESVVNFYGMDEVIVSTRGVRYGMALEAAAID